MTSLAELGWDGGWAEAFEAAGVGGGRPARVVAQHRSRWVILGEGDPTPARLAPSAAPGPQPVTGDWVVATPGPEAADPWSIPVVLRRRSAIRRGAAGDAGGEQVLAANMDRLWVVHALDVPPNLRSLERYLATAWESGATPEIVLTKSDLAEDLDARVRAVRGIAFGVPLRVVSVADAAALTELAGSLAPGRTVALLGPSGAGKSTLVNLLAGSEVARTGAVRSGDRKGRHTTTRRELLPIRGGALLLDTPGMRELRVLELDEGLGRTFPEIAALAAGCRFRDCVHSEEPGCAVREAVERGELPAARLESYRKLEAEAAHERRKRDPRAAAEHAAEHKTAVRTLRYHPKYRGER